MNLDDKTQPEKGYKATLTYDENTEKVTVTFAE